MYTHEVVEKMVLGIPFEEAGIEVQKRRSIMPFETALGKKHFTSKTGHTGNASESGGGIKKNKAM